jgi:hypothetical protein
MFQKDNKWLWIMLGIILTISAVAIVVFYPEEKNSQREESVSSFSECADSGFPIMESYPRKCRTPNREIFTEYIGNELDKTDIIRITNPRPNETVSFPLNITGEARGIWFFEADFPVKIETLEGKKIGQGIAAAENNWMTEEFVDFAEKITLSENYEGKALLILKKDNPSGLEEFDDSLNIPIKISKNAEKTES